MKDTRQRLRLAFYGDDFTGSTDALEVLAFAGVRCALFLEPPTAAMLERFEGGLEAVGVAGDSRAMTPDEMQQHLPAVFDALAALGAPILHYKVCSTFDSGPAIGSIGRVMQIARARFPSSLLPIVAATPRLGRWCLFGHLFARSGTDGQVYRLDRHPIMSVHPVTPMGESELARHLGQQCELKIGSLPFDRYDLGADAAAAHLDALRERKMDAVVLDAVSDAHMTQVGGLLEAEARLHDPLFVVGSSGAEYALTQWWRQNEPGRGATDISRPAADISRPVPGFNRCAPDFGRFAAVDQVLAVSGSASMLSARQIGAAIDAGFADVPADAAALVGPRSDSAAAELVAEAVRLLAAGRSVMLHTARGPQDSRIAAMLQSLQATGRSMDEARHEGGRLLGMRLGEVVREVLRARPVPRLLLSGGDTSSQITKVLGPDALVIVARIAPGAPLCRFVSAAGRFDGLEVTLKGGQMGGADFFVAARDGVA